MRILITGGAGFVGSHLVRQTLSGVFPELADAEVVVLDKLTYAGNQESLAPVRDHPRLTFVRGDVCDEDLVRELLHDTSVVIHCAAETHVDRSIESGKEFVRSNTLGTYTMLEAARQAEVDKFVLVSTDEVYGSTESGSWDESRPLSPNSPYSASKGSGDLMARAYWMTYGLKVSTIRCVNNYGPYQFPEKLIPLFVTNLLDNELVPIYGDGKHVREWIHVDDHCRAIVRTALNGQPGEIYNIGGSAELTNLQVTEALLREMDHDWSSTRFVEDRRGHDRRYSLDDAKAQRELGFEPRIPFEEGLRQTISWYRDNRSWWEPLKKQANV